MGQVHFRFYEELNDYLPEDKKQVWFDVNFGKKTYLQSAIQLFNVPTNEIDLILVN
ncbi:hypothetical protein ACFLTE_04585 [Bacteroidota bacterium]